MMQNSAQQHFFLPWFTSHYILRTSKNQLPNILQLKPINQNIR